MAITIKPMRLIIKKYDTYYSRTVTDLDGNVIFEDPTQKLIDESGLVLMTESGMNDLIGQMKQIPQWNIVEVYNEFAE